MHDVTVSVWNRFHSPHLTEGLTDSGYDVLALGSTRRKPRCSAHRTCWSSALITQASYHVPAAREALTTLGINLFHHFAARHALESRCFWGWSNHHLCAFQKAKAAGIPVILETGSTHIAWARNALSPEYAKHGVAWETPLMKNVTPRILAEYQIADHICVPNSFVARTYEEHGIPQSKLFINPYGMDFDFWSTPPSEKKPTGKWVVIYAGQFMLRKGVAYLMEAWERIGLKNAELWIVGAVLDDARSCLARLQTNVKILGPKNPVELRALFHASDVFILPSLEEGMARASLEAMAAGLPVIVTPETGVGNVVNDGKEGWVIPAKSWEAIAESLQQAASNPDDTLRRGQSACQRAAQFTWKSYGERASGFLRNIISPSMPPPSKG